MIERKMQSYPIIYTRRSNSTDRRAEADYARGQLDLLETGVRYT
jgi:hypothetical protein